MLATTVDASRAERLKRQQDRFRNRGGIFVPSTENPLGAILLARLENKEKSKAATPLTKDTTPVAASGPRRSSRPRSSSKPEKPTGRPDSPERTRDDAGTVTRTQRTTKRTTGSSGVPTTSNQPPSSELLPTTSKSPIAASPKASRSAKKALSSIKARSGSVSVEAKEKALPTKAVTIIKRRKIAPGTKVAEELEADIVNDDGAGQRVRWNLTISQGVAVEGKERALSAAVKSAKAARNAEEEAMKGGPRSPKRRGRRRDDDVVENGEEVNKASISRARSSGKRGRTRSPSTKSDAEDMDHEPKPTGKRGARFTPVKNTEEETEDELGLLGKRSEPAAKSRVSRAPSPATRSEGESTDGEYKSRPVKRKARTKTGVGSSSEKMAKTTVRQRKAVSDATDEDDDPTPKVKRRDPMPPADDEDDTARRNSRRRTAKIVGDEDDDPTPKPAARARSSSKVDKADNGVKSRATKSRVRGSSARKLVEDGEYSEPPPKTKRNKWAQPRTKTMPATTDDAPAEYAEPPKKKVVRVSKRKPPNITLRDSPIPHGESDDDINCL